MTYGKGTVIAVFTAMAVMLSACADSLQDKIAQAEVTYTGAVKTFVDGRKGCVQPGGPTQTQPCLVSDELYKKIDPLVKDGDSTLDTAKAALASGNEDKASVYLVTLGAIITKIQVYLVPVKEGLNK